MAATAMATTAPAVARSSSRRQASYNSQPSERHHQRNPSGSRASATTSDSHRPESQSYSHGRTGSSAQQQSLAAVAKKDWEQSNVGRPSTTHRSSSRDQYHTGNERERSAYTTEPKSGQPRYSSDMPRTPASAGHGSAPTSARSRGDASSHDAAAPVKRRTTITAQTGTWTLGKTIGAGSMGKVKIAKNMATGESVRHPSI